MKSNKIKSSSKILVESLSNDNLIKIYGGNGVMYTPGVNSQGEPIFDAWDTSSGYEDNADYWDGLCSAEIP